MTMVIRTTLTCSFVCCIYTLIYIVGNTAAASLLLFISSGGRTAMDSLLRACRPSEPLKPSHSYPFYTHASISTHPTGWPSYWPLKSYIRKPPPFHNLETAHGTHLNNRLPSIPPPHSEIFCIPRVLSLHHSLSFNGSIY